MYVLILRGGGDSKELTHMVESEGQQAVVESERVFQFKSYQAGEFSLIREWRQRSVFHSVQIFN